MADEWTYPDFVIVHKKRRDRVKQHLQGKLVASCDVCAGRERKDRVENIPRGTIWCPDCNYALYWERLKKKK